MGLASNSIVLIPSRSPLASASHAPPARRRRTFPHFPPPPDTPDSITRVYHQHQSGRAAAEPSRAVSPHTHTHTHTCCAASPTTHMSMWLMRRTLRSNMYVCTSTSAIHAPWSSSRFRPPGPGPSLGLDPGSLAGTWETPSSAGYFLHIFPPFHSHYICRAHPDLLSFFPSGHMNAGSSTASARP